MPKNRGPKSNANRRNRATRRTDRLAHVPPHIMVTYDASPAALSIDLDFYTPRSIAEEEEIFDELVETIPQYADETNIINLGMIFRNLLNDAEGVNRRDILARVVQIINDFPHIKGITFSLIIDHYNWKQVSCTSAIYSLKFHGWTFDMKVKDGEFQPVLSNSPMDRGLRAAEAKLLRQAL
ncbi:hypothetical protein EAE96_003358 [Botrytis aclada]|nr:hypothetical protein EAE96_003358 [Botrytis aclada]